MKSIVSKFSKQLIIILALASFAWGTTTLKYKVNPEKCTSCTVCVSTCPTQAITMVDDKALIDPEKCIGCGVCATVCPVQAIDKDSTTISSTE